VTIPSGLAPQLERVGERFLMGSYKTGKVLLQSTRVSRPNKRQGRACGSSCVARPPQAHGYANLDEKLSIGSVQFLHYGQVVA
jgi:hypothetical protein